MVSYRNPYFCLSQKKGSSKNASKRTKSVEKLSHSMSFPKLFIIRKNSD